MTIQEVLSRRTDELLRLPYVVDVAATEKDGRDAVLVFVSRLTTPGDLAPRDRIPAYIDGYPTVVDLAPTVG